MIGCYARAGLSAERVPEAPRACLPVWMGPGGEPPRQMEQQARWRVRHMVGIPLGAELGAGNEWTARLWLQRQTGVRPQTGVGPPRISAGGGVLEMGVSGEGQVSMSDGEGLWLWSGGVGGPGAWGGSHRIQRYESE